MRKSRGNRMAIALILMLIVLAAGVFFYFHSQNKNKSEQAGVEETDGERHHGWTPFYHADKGIWRMLDPWSYVLREQKYVSSDRERDEYLVKKVQMGGILRILQAQGRWKEVEVMENGRVVATGWIDADPIRNVVELEKLPEEKAGPGI